MYAWIRSIECKLWDNSYCSSFYLSELYSSRYYYDVVLIDSVLPKGKFCRILLKLVCVLICGFVCTTSTEDKDRHPFPEERYQEYHRKTSAKEAKDFDVERELFEGRQLMITAYFLNN